MNPFRNRAKATLDLLNSLILSGRRPAGPVETAPAAYAISENVPEGLEWEPFGRDDTWGGSDKHFWFRCKVDTSAFKKGRPAVLVLETGADDVWNTDNPQVLGYVNGGMTSTLDMNHNLVRLSPSWDGEEYDVAFHAYSNYSGKTNFFHLDAASEMEEVKALYYDMKCVFDAAGLLEDDDTEAILADKALNAAVNVLDLRKPGSDDFLSSVEKARAFLKNEYYDKRSVGPLMVHAVGHTHIDIAWKWPLRQTRQKAVRSFQTVLNLMERYPDYVFMSSQPQLYEFVREDAPWLFGRIRERVAEGRWECEGGMWLEPDCNLSSGESLVRHFLHGTRYFEKVMGAPKNEVLWLPDVFGYCAALPQIMKGFGIKYFMTTKIGWNDRNLFPHDTFIWRGLDGSEVLAHLITTVNWSKYPRKNFSVTYNGLQTAGHLSGTWQRYQDKDVSNLTLTCFGHGDGGGGTTEEMVEYSRRYSKTLGRTPSTRQGTVKEFFHDLEAGMDRSRLHTWTGEIYLEYHRGTYTSVVENKKFNRKAERALLDAEQLSVLAKTDYPSDDLGKAWKLLLLNQFHDILPGSATKEVHDESWEQYGEILRTCGEISEKALGAISGGEGGNLIAANTLSSARTTTAILPKGTLAPGLSQTTSEGETIALLEVPALGWKVTAPGKGKTARNVLEAADGVFKTPFHDIVFAPDGSFASVFDKVNGREVLKGPGNQLTAYEDRPMEYDNWNVEEYYKEKSWPLDFESLEVVENGPVRAVVRVRRSFLSSTVVQDVRLYAHTPRIDISTTIDWNEHHILLKALFPVDVFSDKATFEVQFGAAERPTHSNTSWDEAKFEVCHHKWVDISEPGYGVAVLNDSRYGVSAKDGVIGLTLLKSGTFPNTEADIGRHETTYSLFPHAGGWREAGVVREALDLNTPLHLAATSRKEESFSFARVEKANIIAETLKKAEDGEDLVMRLYESEGARTKCQIEFADEYEVFEADMAENTTREAEFPIVFRPYEIKTLVLKRRS